MKTHFTPDELLLAHNQSERLAPLIRESNGYCLHQMMRAGLMPPLDTLMECLSPDSLLFIVDYYELNAEQKKKLAPFFLRTLSHSKREALPSEDEADNALREGVLLRKNTVLTIRQLNTFSDEIDQQFALGGDEIADILEASVRSLSLQEFMHLDRNFLKNNVFLFDVLPKNYQDEAYRALYLELRRERSRESRVPLQLDDFKKWPFRLEDRPFLIQLIQDAQDHRQLSYAEFSQIPGAAALVSAIEFFQNTQTLSIDEFSSTELLLHKQTIQIAWIEQLQEKPDNLYPLFNFKASTDQFKLIVDLQFGARFYGALSPFSFPDFFRDDPESVEKMRHLKRVLFLAGVENGHLLDSFSSVYALSHDFEELCKHRKSFAGGTEDLELMGRMTDAVLPVLLDSTHPLFVENLRNLSIGWFRSENLSNLKHFAQQNPSPNLLFALLKMWEARKEHSTFHSPEGLCPREDWADLIQSVCSTLDPTDAQCLCTPFQFPFTPSAGAVPLASSLNNNFLKADYSLFYEYSPDFRSFLMDYDPHFYDRFQQAQLKPDDVLLQHALSRASTSDRHLELCKKLVNQDPDHARQLPQFYQKLLKHEKMPHIIRVDEESNTLQLFQAIQSELILLRDVSEAVFLAHDLFRQAQKSGTADPHTRQLENNYSLLSERYQGHQKNIQNCADQVSFTQVSQWIDAALSQQDYLLYSTLALPVLKTQQVHEKFALHAQTLTHDEFLLALHCPELRSLIKSFASYTRSRPLHLDFGNPATNRQVAQALLCCFPDDPASLLTLFSHQALHGFSNAFALEFLPQQVPYSYSLQPQILKTLDESERSSHSIFHPYTDEQLLQLWRQADSGTGFFNCMDDNARLQNFISSNFAEDEARYLGFIQKAQRYPKLYCLLINSDLSEQFSVPHLGKRKDGDDPRKYNLDRIHMDYVHSHFDWDTIVQGVGELLDEIGLRTEPPSSHSPHPFYPKQIFRVIDAVIWSTYYDYTDAQNQRHDVSCLTHEQSAQLLQMIYDKGSLFLYGMHTCGSIVDVGEYVGTHIGQMARGDAFQKIFLPPPAHRSEHFSLRGRFSGYATQLIGGTLRWMLSNPATHELEAVDWLLKLKQFQETELQYDVQYTSAYHQTAAPDFLQHIAETPELSQLLQIGVERAQLQALSSGQAAPKKKPRSL